MKVLLDSHVVFWAMLKNDKLSSKVSLILDDPTNRCFISPVSHWEMALKISVGKYRISDDFQTLWSAALARFPVLTIEPAHTAQLIAMPFHHKDPFDRLLIAQALAENIPLVSADALFDAYGVQRLW